MNPVTILLAEDSPEDVELLREAFEHHRFAAELHPVSDGVEAMAYLRGEGEHAGAPQADMMLLDLNMPRMDGREVLAAVKNDPKLQSLPVVILTTSNAPEDVTRSYEHRASAFLTKPPDFDAFLELTRRLGEFWLHAATLPSRAGASGHSVP
ncbi:MULTISPECIES: response regulator [Thioalkalivibrio]|uniref:Response regulator n=1 Tax=Thioalkalivibrio halophilus TaxID=252474 RepID=A0A1V2ZY25_9GAMM|nr:MULTISPECIES: response regulator [Thioalkalivibrio]OOC10012.1 response regulator [Thioalkalivibrio halophilus]PYG03417.1 CheY-like chemotaxis protein [Thioalkalivibrio sp. ALE21]